jgi:23S rRNA (pseudouridine1915-N3)-methyltransferase
MPSSLQNLLHISILPIGKIKDRELALKARDFTERISHDIRLTIESIKDSHPEQEARRLLAHIKKQPGFVFALSEHGQSYTSETFSSRLYGLGPKVYFIIGGPFGLPSAIQKGADELLSLSTMTFPHEMAQVMLLEQLYRAVSIHHKRKYHK